MALQPAPLPGAVEVGTSLVLVKSDHLESFLLPCSEVHTIQTPLKKKGRRLACKPFMDKDFAVLVTPALPAAARSLPGPPQQRLSKRYLSEFPQ